MLRNPSGRRGRGPLAPTEYTMNFDNRTLFIADSLDIMRGMDSGTIDLIYLDPPFKSGKQWESTDRLTSRRRGIQRHLDRRGYQIRMARLRKDFFYGNDVKPPIEIMKR